MKTGSIMGPPLCSAVYLKLYADRVMIRQRYFVVGDQIGDSQRPRAVGQRDPTAGKPIQPAGNRAANPIGRPKNERKAPPRHPIAKVCILLDALDVIVDRAETDLIKKLIYETATLSV